MFWKYIEFFLHIKKMQYYQNIVTVYETVTITNLIRMTPYYHVYHDCVNDES